MFPTSTWSFRREHICPRDRKSLKRYEEYVPYYQMKHKLAQRVAPKRILEIGVRAGYSALAFLEAAPEASYTGLDAECGKHGGEGGPWMDWARQLLSGFDVALIKLDTQKQTDLTYLGQFDLVHVDGDHSYAGALHDMELCWPLVSPNGLLLIDDYCYLEPVRKAVVTFANIRVEAKDAVFELEPSLRGEALFWKGAAKPWLLS